MKKIIFCLIILVCVSTIVYAEELIMDRAHIEVGGTWNEQIQWYDPAFCGAVDEDTQYYPGSDIRQPCNYIAFIQVIQQNDKVKAICKFTDASETYSQKARMGKIENCNLISGGPTSGFRTFVGGTGTITATANPGGEQGSNVIIECTFDLDDCIDCVD